jgi:hypothetical protein
VGPSAGLDDVEKIKFLTLLGLELRPLRSSSPYAVAIPTTLFSLLTHSVKDMKRLDEKEDGEEEFLLYLWWLKIRLLIREKYCILNMSASLW